MTDFTLSNARSARPAADRIVQSRDTQKQSYRAVQELSTGMQHIDVYFKWTRVIDVESRPVSDKIFE